MKKIIESLFALGMLFATVGCDQDQIVAKFDTSGEDAGTAYFVKNAVSENFEASATGTQTINLDLFRQDAAGELTVGLTAEMDEAAAKFFRIPESVTFADGDYRVIVPVSVLDVEKFDKGVTYAVSISVNNAGTENESSASIGSKYASVTLSASLTLNWVPCYVLKDFSKLLSTDLTDADYVVGPDGKPMLQGGVYTYTFWWEGEDDTVMLERAEGTNVFRLTNWGGGVKSSLRSTPTRRFRSRRSMSERTIPTEPRCSFRIFLLPASERTSVRGTAIGRSPSRWFTFWRTAVGSAKPASRPSC